MENIFKHYSEEKLVVDTQENIEIIRVKKLDNNVMNIMQSIKRLFILIILFGAIPLVSMISPKLSTDERLYPLFIVGAVVPLIVGIFLLKKYEYIDYFPCVWEDVKEKVRSKREIKKLKRQIRIVTNNSAGVLNIIKINYVLKFEEHEHERANLVRVLGEKRVRKAIPSLIDRLSDSFSVVRKAAKEALEKLEVTKEQLVECYIRVLSSGKFYSPSDYLYDRCFSYLNVQEFVIVELGKLGDKKAVEPLLIKLSDIDRGLLDIKTANYFFDSDREEASEYLEMARRVQKTIIKVMVILGDKKAVHPLLERLSDESDEVRMEVIEALGNFDDKRANTVADVWKKLLSRMPEIISKKYKAANYILEAIEFKRKGYDFRIIYTPPQGGYSQRPTGEKVYYSYGTNVTDTDEEVMETYWDANKIPESIAVCKGKEADDKAIIKDIFDFRRES